MMTESDYIKLNRWFVLRVKFGYWIHPLSWRVEYRCWRSRCRLRRTFRETNGMTRKEARKFVREHFYR